MKIRRATWLLPLVATAGVALTLGPPGISAEACGPSTSLTASAGSLPATAAGSEASTGSGVAATSEDEIVMIDQSGTASSYQHVGTAAGVLRHPSAEPGMGTVYVNDVAGQDILTAVTPTGAVEHPIAGDAVHPAWTADGDVAFSQSLESLRVWTPGSGTLRTIDRPAGTLSVFSPLAHPAGDLVAVVEEAVAGAPADGAGLDNLYRFDAAATSWHRLTSFAASGDDWSVIRTPIVDRDGSILFVRVRGSSSQTGEPAFELWRFRDGTTFKVRNLPGERFLAGVIDAGLLWNVDQDGRWMTLLEKDRRLREVSCGAGMVDPRSEIDLDLVEGGDTQVEPATVDPIPGNPQMGIAVGDFATREEATVVATELGLAGLTVVDHAEAPFAVAPGAYAVVRPFASGEDMEAGLDAFRTQFPKYAETSWIVSLVGGGTGEG